MALDGGVKLHSRPGRFTPGTNLIRSWVGQSRFGRSGEEKKIQSLLLPGIEILFVQPVALSLY